MSASRRARLGWQHNLNAYFSDDSPDRQLPAVIPFPEGPIKPFLHRRQYLARLPYNLRPPARVVTTGNAWSLDAVTACGRRAGTVHLGLLERSRRAHRDPDLDAVRSVSDLTLAVSGYPARPGNSLAIESTVDPRARAWSTPGPIRASGGSDGTSIGAGCRPAESASSPWTDARRTARGSGSSFLSTSPWPRACSRPSCAICVPVSAAVLALIGVWGYRRQRGARS